jgi:hypothetical protein
MATYANTSLAQAQALVSSRLGDYLSVFWTPAEIAFYIQDALREFNAVARFYKNVFPILTAPATTFYDLLNGTQNPATLLQPVITDQYCVNFMQYLLMEPINTWAGIPGSSPGFTWNGSAQFTMADLLGALQRRRDEFLLRTGMVQQAMELAAGPPPTLTVPYPSNVIDIRRAAWIDMTPTLTIPPGSPAFFPLSRGDKLSFDLNSIGWNVNSGLPYQYSVSDDPLLTLQLAPVSSLPGAMSIVAVFAGATLNVSANNGAGTLLGVPDDFAWVPIFGALADLLGRDGEAKDEMKAGYCTQRWEQGLQVAELASSTMRVEINGLAAPVSTPYAADHNIPGWQNGTGTPYQVIQFSFNLLALTPAPSTQNDQVTVDTVTNATVPVLATDFLQVGAEHLDAVLDYAQHLASFKLACGEFSRSMPLLGHFYSVAADNNRRLKANSKLFEAMMRTAAYPLMDTPMRRQIAGLEAA